MKGYGFGDPRAPNVLLHGIGETPWKVVLKCDYAKQEFVLFIQDTAFTDLPIQIDIVPDQPQNIELGNVKFNGFLMHRGYKQYSLWKQDLIKKPIVTDIVIDNLLCSSSNVVN